MSEGSSLSLRRSSPPKSAACSSILCPTRALGQRLHSSPSIISPATLESRIYLATCLSRSWSWSQCSVVSVVHRRARHRRHQTDRNQNPEKTQKVKIQSRPQNRQSEIGIQGRLSTDSWILYCESQYRCYFWLHNLPAGAKRMCKRLQALQKDRAMKHQTLHIRPIPILFFVSRTNRSWKLTRMVEIKIKK